MAEKNKIGREMINPFYYLGEEHNNGLEYVGGKLDIKDITIEKLMDEVSN